MSDDFSFLTIKYFNKMNDWISDFIITVTITIGVVIIKILPKKIKWGWRLVIGLLSAIMLSTIGHLIIKLYC